MPPKAKAKSGTANTGPPPTKDMFILTLRDQVVFPSIRSTVVLSPDVFSKLTDYCEKYNTNVIGCVAARPAGETSANGEELYMVGTYGKLMSQRQETRKAGGKEETVTRVSIEGKGRFRVTEFTQSDPYRLANIDLMSEVDAPKPEDIKELRESVQQSIMNLVQETAQNPTGGPANPLTNFLGGAGGKQQIKWPASASLLADMVGAGVGRLSTPERQQVLEEADVKKRLELVLGLLTKMKEAAQMTKELNTNMKKKTDAEMRDTIIRRQIGELQKELRKIKGKPEPTEEEAEKDGDWDDGDEDEEDDLATVKEMLKKANLPSETKKIALREFKRLQNIQPQHPEYMVCRTYLDLLASLPWDRSTGDSDNLKEARVILDKDHYGLEKVKRRILEFLAVRKLRNDMKGPILCLNGPPGVGKTSLGRSVARALNRRFYRVALGGVRDEAELRGHRRTYIGSMPGVIIEALRTTNTNNPVMLLDEIDKLTNNSNQGNPSGALLEILDPEQNHTFKDHYMNTPFNLSKVLFLATCNDTGYIDRALLDRMEIIDLNGYTVEEKLHIATGYLLPKVRRVHALEKDDPESLQHAASQEATQRQKEEEEREAMMSGKKTDEDEDKEKKDEQEKSEEGEGVEAKKAKEPEGPEEPLMEITEDAIQELIQKWTQESGVRQIERMLATVCRFAALKIANSLNKGQAEAMARQDGAVAGSTGTGQTQEITESVKEAEEALAECGPIEGKTAAGNPIGKVFIDVKHLKYIVGMEMVEPEIAERLQVGVAMGLSVSGFGGSLLFIEASKVRGSGALTVTGNLRDVMRESVRTAMSLLRSKVYSAISEKEGGFIMPEVVEGGTGATPEKDGESEPADDANLTPMEALTAKQRAMKNAKDLFSTVDVHVHFPAGAIPKDGPSAGVAIMCALTSLFTDRVVRSDTAVTGEVTLRGHVLPVGGIKDKVLAAHRAGLKHVLLPDANRKDVKEDLTESVLKDIQIHYMKTIDEGIEFAFGVEGLTETDPVISAPSAVPSASARAASALRPPRSAF